LPDLCEKGRNYLIYLFYSVTETGYLLKQGDSYLLKITFCRFDACLHLYRARATFK